MLCRKETEQMLLKDINFEQWCCFVERLIQVDDNNWTFFLTAEIKLQLVNHRKYTYIGQT